MVSMATYGAIGAALGGAIVIAQERDGGWTRQLRVTPLPSSAYVAGKLVVAYLVTVPAIAAVLVAGLLVDHVELAPVAWLAVLAALAIGSLPFAALGLLIGYTFDANSAQGAMMISFFSLAILGGLWAPLSSFPDTLATIGRMLPSSRLADLGRDAAAGVAPDPAAIAILAAYAIVIGGLAAWRYRSAEPSVPCLTAVRPAPAAAHPSRARRRCWPTAGGELVADVAGGRRAVRRLSGRPDHPRAAGRRSWPSLPLRPRRSSRS